MRWWKLNLENQYIHGIKRKKVYLCLYTCKSYILIFRGDCRKRTWESECHFLKTMGRSTIKMTRRRSVTAIQVHLGVFFWCFLATCNWWTPPLTKELALARWLSMSSNWSAWECTNTAMSMNTRCSSFRFLSISIAASCLSWISLTVSNTLPLPCCCMAFCKNLSLSPMHYVYFSPLIRRHFLIIILIIRKYFVLFRYIYLFLSC